MSIGMYIILGLAVILVIILIRGAIAWRNIAKLLTAKKELREMPIDEWESKWGEFVQKEVNKCNDPHKQEIEEYIEFLKQFIRESEKGGEDGRNQLAGLQGRGSERDAAADVSKLRNHRIRQ